MAEEKYKILAAEFLKQHKLLEEVMKTGSKIKIFRMAFFVSQDIYFEPSEKDIEMAFEEAERILLEARKKEREDKKELEEKNETEHKKDGKKDENDALYLLDLFEKYVE